jgi:hypothetical protein
MGGHEASGLSRKMPANGVDRMIETARQYYEQGFERREGVDL